MTVIKNGMKTTLRTPGKTVLFSLILTALAVLICTSFCVFAVVRNYLKDCDEYYHTVVNTEFVGKDYPNGFAYDTAMASAVEAHEPALNALRRSDAVIRFEPVTHALAEIDGLTRKDKFVYDPDAAVLEIYIIGFDQNTGSYLASVTDPLYSRTDVSGKMVMMRNASMHADEKPVLAVGDRYVVCGHFFTATTSYPSFRAEDLTFYRGGEAVTVPEQTALNALTPETEAAYNDLAAYMRACNSRCTVQTTAAIDDLLPFHQQELTLREGRFFTQEEYASAAKVCIVSNRIADALEITAGDEIGIALCTCDGDLYAGRTVRSETERYAVVGVYDRNDDYPATVFLPDAAAANAPFAAGNGFGLGVFRVKNTSIAAFLTEAKPLEQYGFRFTAYDQGYSAVVEPMSELMLISVIFLAICIALTAGALSLQCHIFITRQRDAAQTMLAMGSGRTHVRLYFLSAAGMLSIPAAAIGCVVGKLTENAVFRLLERFAAQFAEQDLRFSSSRLTLIRTLTFTPRVSSAVYFAAGAALLFGVVLFTLLFTRGVLRDRAVRKKRARAPRAPKRIRRSTQLSGFLKYALLSVRRNRVRTVAVLLLCLLVALFFGRLTTSLDGYRTQLDAVRNNTVLKGHATDGAGRRIDGLVVGKNAFDTLMNTAPDLCIQVSRNMGHLRFSGIPVTADGVSHEIPPPEIPETSFGIETMVGQMYDEPLLIQTSDVMNSTVFYYAEPTVFEWLDGVDAESFYDSEANCVMAGPMMDRHGIRLGDTVVFIRAYEGFLGIVTLRVVGRYLTASGDETVLAPFNVDRLPLYSRNKGFDSLIFVLDDASRLDALRGTLEDAGFSPVRTRSARTFAVIDDEVYLDTTHSMERQIKYVSVLYDSLYVLTGLIGFVLAWLLVSSRRREIALMRALGMQPRRVIAVFFTEQLLLSCAGLGLGLLLRTLLGRASGPQLWILVLIFFAVWLVSTLICLLVSVGKQAYAALTEPE